MPRGKLVAVDVVGGEQVVGREQVLSETHAIRVVFRDFANIPHARGDQTRSSALLCHGYQWQLQLFPGGHDASKTNTVHTSLHLQCVFAELDDQFRVSGTVD
jgi:hypothetical protein